MLLNSCSSVKYGLILGGQKNTYTENVDAEAFFSDETLHLPDYKNTSLGFHVGISEESDLLLTKIFYFSNSYDDKKYEINNKIFDTKISETGFGGSIGFKIFWFQPHIGFRKYNAKYTLDNDVEEESYTTLIYGLDFEIPISSSLFIYTGFSTGKQTNIELAANAFVTQVITHDEVNIGLRWNFGSSTGK